MTNDKIYCIPATDPPHLLAAYTNGHITRQEWVLLYALYIIKERHSQCDVVS